MMVAILMIPVLQSAPQLLTMIPHPPTACACPSLSLVPAAKNETDLKGRNMVVREDRGPKVPASEDA